jgi:hypothetical protein
MMSNKVELKGENKIINNHDDREDIRIGYQVAIQMWSAECSNYWSSISAFIQVSLSLIGASFLPKFVGLKEQTASLVGLILSFIGFTASIIWLIFNRRFEKILNYWILSARELEEKMSKHVSAIQRGRRFSEGKKVTVAGSNVGYNFIESLTIGHGFVIVHLLFIVIFVSLIVLNLLKVIGMTF